MDLCLFDGDLVYHCAQSNGAEESGEAARNLMAQKLGRAEIAGA